jgi:hypothetical protein
MPEASDLPALVGYAGTAILVLEGDELVFAGIRNPGSFTIPAASTPAGARRAASERSTWESSMGDNKSDERRPDPMA